MPIVFSVGLLIISRSFTLPMSQTSVLIFFSLVRVFCFGFISIYSLSKALAQFGCLEEGFSRFIVFTFYVGDQEVICEILMSPLSGVSWTKFDAEFFFGC